MNKILKTIVAALIVTIGLNFSISYAGNFIRASQTVSTNTIVPVTGDTVSINGSNDSTVVLNPAGTLTTLTISLPSNPKDGDKVTITANAAITALTFTNGTVNAAPTSLSAGSSISLIHMSFDHKWNQYAGIGGSGGLDKIVGVSGAVQGAVVRFQSGAYGMAASVCGMFSDATTCSKALGYADPRQFGSTCSATSGDDGAGIQAALNTGVPVMIPYPRCTVINKINFTANGQTIFSFGSGGRYNSNYPGNPYIFIQNTLWDNRATSLNCAFDTKGYDGITFKNITLRGNYALVGSVGICNSVGHQSGLAAGFLNLQDVAFLNLGNGVGAAMVSYFDDNPANPGTAYGGETPCTPISTGPQAVLNNTFFQVHGQSVYMIGNCMGMYGNLSDLHLNDFYGAGIMHNVFSTLDTYAGGIELSNGRVEYSGYGSWVTDEVNRVYWHDGAGIFVDGPWGTNISNVTCDHQYGTCITGGSHALGVNLTNIFSIDSGFNNRAGITDKGHFAFLGVKGLSATNIQTRKNGVATPYVVTFRGTNMNVRWEGTGGTPNQTTGPGGWATNYFNFVTTPTPFSYDVLGIGHVEEGTPTTFNNLLGYTETPYDAGNSGTALTLNLANGTFQKITATGNATVTMPAVVSGKRFTIRYYTGAGSFTAAFTGVKWPGGVTPTLTATASRMDVFTFVSDGTNWYGSVSQNYTP